MRVKEAEKPSAARAGGRALRSRHPAQRGGGQGEAGAGAGAGSMAAGARGAGGRGLAACCGGAVLLRAAGGAGAAGCSSTNTGFGTSRGPPIWPASASIGSVEATTRTGTVCGW